MVISTTELAVFEHDPGRARQNRVRQEHEEISRNYVLGSSVESPYNGFQTGVAILKRMVTIHHSTKFGRELWNAILFLRSATRMGIALLFHLNHPFQF